MLQNFGVNMMIIIKINIGNIIHMKITEKKLIFRIKHVYIECELKLQISLFRTLLNLRVLELKFAS